MPQSLSSILIHLIFSTKHRQPFITPQIEVELHPYMASIFRAMKSPALALDGTEALTNESPQILSISNIHHSTFIIRLASASASCSFSSLLPTV